MIVRITALIVSLSLPAASACAAQHYAVQGIAMDLDVAATEGLQTGADVRFSLHLSDAAAGAPLVAAQPAAWLSLNRRGVPSDDRTCMRKVAAFLGSNPLARPEVDLTGFLLLTLNRDPSITVIDPQSGYRGSRVLAALPLDSPGADWAVGRDPPRVYISEPDTGRIAVIDTEQWRRSDTLPVSGHPEALILQHNGHILWVATEESIVAFDTSELKSASVVPVRRGTHRLAITGDDRFLAAANRDDGTVTLIDTATMTKLRDVRVGTTTGPIAVSALASAIYVAADGAVAVIDPSRDVAPMRIEAITGVTAVGISPSGRWGFAVSAERGSVAIFDTATNRTIQTVPVPDRPYEIGFTETQAYIRRRDSEAVTLIPLGPLQADGKTAGVAEFPAGERPGSQHDRAIAASMVSSGGEAAMLLASPDGHAVHYYREGMAAPADSFDDFGHQPVAVTIVDHSLRQTVPGTYSAIARLPRAGVYDLAVLLDSPRVTHCFPLTVAARASDAAGTLTIEPLALPANVPAGRPIALSFHVATKSAGQRAPDGITALTILAPGSWFERVPMAAGADGIWTMTFTPPHAGIYLLAFEAPAQGMDVNASPHLTIEVTEPHE